MLPEEGLSRSLELLARELSLQQIAHISQNTRVPLEKHLH
jgi:collagenase-like PrtC family protease